MITLCGEPHLKLVAAGKGGQDARELRQPWVLQHRPKSCTRVAAIMMVMVVNMVGVAPNSVRPMVPMPVLL